MTTLLINRKAATVTDRRPATLGTLPLVWRDEEIAALSRALDDAERGTSATIFLAGEGGIGKTRLAEHVVTEAARRKWSVAVGRAYPVETGVPYALFSDALLPTLRSMDSATLAVVSRGGEAELARLFPALDLKTDSRAARGDAADVKARLLWNFSQFLSRFAAKKPLLLVLENLQWADASSLELLHFVARQIASERILLIGTYNDADPRAADAHSTLRSMESSLVALGAARTIQLLPLDAHATLELVQRVIPGDGTD